MSLSRQQFTLLGIFALFLGPVILVVMMRSSWWQYQPDGMKNQGYLVQPPLQLPLHSTQGFANKWLILHAFDQSCDRTCIDHVTALRQIHKATGRNSKHLAIVLLSHKKPTAQLQSRLKSIYPEFKIVTDSTDGILTVLDTVKAAAISGTDDSDPIHTYILDPRLNIILAYGAQNDPSDIHGDIKKLLKWSDQEK